MKKVILDTNILVTAYNNKFDIIDELRLNNFEVFVIDRIIEELEKIKAKLVIDILKVKNVKILKTGKIKLKGVDPVLLKLAKEGYVIATLDKELKNKLNKYITLRKGKKLFIKVDIY